LFDCEIADRHMYDEGGISSFDSHFANINDWREISNLNFEHVFMRVSIHTRLCMLLDAPVELGRRVTRNSFMPYGQYTLCITLCYTLSQKSLPFYFCEYSVKY